MTRTRRRTGAALLAIGLLAAGAAVERQAADTVAAAEQDDATAVFAGGCFWCVEEAFDKVDGVLETTSGYIGGHVRNPTYEQVASGDTGHIEAVRVRYAPAKVSYEALLQTFWRSIDPLDDGGQFCDRGDQYRSAIFTLSPEQQRLADASKERIAKELRQPVATMVTAAQTFYPAEAYHQDYYRQNPVRYRFYKWNCGRAQRLEEIWGRR